jgi:hypothetical protein
VYHRRLRLRACLQRHGLGHMMCLTIVDGGGIPLGNDLVERAPYTLRWRVSRRTTAVFRLCDRRRREPLEPARANPDSQSYVGRRGLSASAALFRRLSLWVRSSSLVPTYSVPSGWSSRRYTSRPYGYEVPRSWKELVPLCAPSYQAQRQSSCSRTLATSTACLDLLTLY